jgi:uncharacterized circularly permuted ATP-grasp superfamily protein/uncharacterized alpha-E superfamily protein
VSEQGNLGQGDIVPPGQSQKQASPSSEALTFGYGPIDPGSGGGEPAFDEIVTGNGSLRAHWQTLLARLSPLNAVDMAERVEESTRLLRQNDVTYTIYGDPQNAERLWPLDVMPLLIPADEWRTIAAGVLQRAKFLNALLADIYGARSVVEQGLLPPVLLEANPRFLRPCHDLSPAGGIYLHLYAVDLGRMPDGTWSVLADRTETPSGAGYALENRSVIGRVLADCMNDARVAPLMPFFNALRDGLSALAPPNRVGTEPPRIVLLTPGPYNETYFEHLFLAGQLGVTLVQGADLTVRDRRVYIKTVSALEPVDIILRRVDDNFCDPLELYRDSALGVAGLLEAVRAGTVTVANALGAGVVQAAAFKPFFPTLARHLIGEDLLLPEVSSWWCGRDAQKDYVLAHLDNLVVRPAFSPLSVLRAGNADPASSDRETLMESIAARPYEFVGQSRAVLSNAPVWENGKLEPRPVSLRVYVAAGPEGFVVMPGGLTRTSRLGGPHAMSMQTGGGSKDTWILDDAMSRGQTQAQSQSQTQGKASSNVVMLPEISVRRLSPGALPSRVADSLFWTGRYAERTNSAVRLLRTIVAGLTDPARGWDLQDAEPALNLAAYTRLLPWIDPAAYSVPQVISLVQQSLTDPAYPGGIRKHLAQLTAAAGNVRDRLPADSWHALTSFGRASQLSSHRATPVQILLRLNDILTLGTSLAGTVDESMPRNDSWHFLEIGKRLERAIHLVTLMRGISGVRLDDDGEFAQVSERRQLQAIVALVGTNVVPPTLMGLDRRTVLDAVLSNGDDPRTLIYQLISLNTHLALLPQSIVREGAAANLVPLAAERVAKALTMTREAIQAAVRPAASGKKAAGEAPVDNSLRAVFAPLDEVLPEISDLLSRAYFTHAFARRA